MHRDILKQLYPSFSEEELAQAEEAFRQYLFLAAQIYEEFMASSDHPLTNFGECLRSKGKVEHNKPNQ